MTYGLITKEYWRAWDYVKGLLGVALGRSRMKYLERSLENAEPVELDGSQLAQLLKIVDERLGIKVGERN